MLQRQQLRSNGMSSAVCFRKFSAYRRQKRQLAAKSRRQEVAYSWNEVKPENNEDNPLVGHGMGYKRCRDNLDRCTTVVGETKERKLHAVARF